ncbi:MAG: hypothetical protein V4619_01355 [Bacteroidota bacterium]
MQQHSAGQRRRSRKGKYKPVQPNKQYVANNKKECDKYTFIHKRF